MTGADAELRCVHCSIVANTSADAYKQVRATTNAYIYFKNSMVSNLDTTGNTIRIDGGASFSDGGYNAWGINSVSGFSGVTAPEDRGNRILTEALLTDVVAADVALVGGSLKSLKPVANSSLIDAIPNDAPGLQVGTTPASPFTSLAQAHAGIKFYSSYSAGYYFFQIGGLSFKTYVDDEGYVLLGSDNGATSNPLLAQDSIIALLGDEILNSSIAALLDISEIKITAPGSKLGDFDMRTNNATLAAEIVAYDTLSNNFALGKSVWWGTHEANMSNATASDKAQGVTNGLDLNVMGHWGDGTQGFHWQLERGLYQTVTWASQTPRDNMHIWVRNSSGNCDAVVDTDQRGLPRPDYVNPADTSQYGDIRDCDIGSFEWNEAYRLDCHAEDGLRPEFSITYNAVGFCIGNAYDSLTPKAIVNNFGSMNWMALVLLGGLFGFRIYRKSKSQ